MKSDTPVSLSRFAAWRDFDSEEPELRLPWVGRCGRTFLANNYDVLALDPGMWVKNRTVPLAVPDGVHRAVESIFTEQWLPLQKFHVTFPDVETTPCPRLCRLDQDEQEMREISSHDLHHCPACGNAGWVTPWQFIRKGVYTLGPGRICPYPLNKIRHLGVPVAMAYNATYGHYLFEGEGLVGRVSAVRQPMPTIGRIDGLPGTLC